MNIQQSRILRHSPEEKHCMSLEDEQVFYAWKHNDVVDNNGVDIEVGKREVHNLLIYAAKLWTYGVCEKTQLLQFVIQFVILWNFEIINAFSPLVKFHIMPYHSNLVWFLKMRINIAWKICLN